MENKIPPVNDNISGKKTPQIVKVADMEDAKLNFALWYLSHLTMFKKFIFFVLLAISVVTWGYFLISFVHYLAFGMRQDDKMLADLANNDYIGHKYFEINKTSNIEATPVETIMNKDKKFDFIVELKNSNLKYWAEFDYIFSAGTQVVKKGRGFILPDESKYLLSLSNEIDGSDAIDFNFENVSWHRINQKNIPDWQQFRDEHLNINIKDKKFSASNETMLSEKLALSRVKFTAQNNTPYNYQEQKFNIVLRRGGSIAGVNAYFIEEFMSGRSYPVEISWKGDLGYVSEIEIVPDINILDDSVYIKFGLAPEGASGKYY